MKTAEKVWKVLKGGSRIASSIRIQLVQIVAANSSLNRTITTKHLKERTRKVMAKKIKIHYRAPSHVPLWKVMEEGGFLGKAWIGNGYGVPRRATQASHRRLESRRSRHCLGQSSQLIRAPKRCTAIPMSISGRATTLGGRIFSFAERASTDCRISKAKESRWTIMTATRD